MSKTIYIHRAAGLVLAGALACGGAETPAKFLGANSCASSGCHGGGGEKQNQFLVWSLKDFHSQRPAATLTTARSKQIAEALAIKDPTADARCTTCHAPLPDVSKNHRDEDFKVSEGVSCESCHGPAENWLRSHTRKDYTRADRTAAGMHDLQNLYVRANTCVACHQNVDADILKAGHPDLIFELDGQSVAEPKHWRVEKNGNGAQAWLVGQAVALREMSWQLAPMRTPSPTDNQLNRWRALDWLMMQIPSSVPVRSGIASAGSLYFCEQQMGDDIALNAAKISWSDEWTRKTLFAFTGLSQDFQDSSVSQSLQARRAERLVLALDRLVSALPEFKNNAPVQSALNQLFKLAQSVPDFDPKQFTAALNRFSIVIAAH